MKLKSYYSETVEAAMDLARRELGEEALLVNARPASPETRYLGAYEVVFGANGKPVAETGAAPTTDRFTSDRFADEIAGLKREFERMFQSLRDARFWELPVQHMQNMPLESADRSPVHSCLLAQGLDSDLVRSVEAGTRLEELFTTNPSLGIENAPRRVVVLLGPPGAGKTTTLAKLAVRYGLETRKPTQILSADVRRIGAADQLVTLASILGIGCNVAETIRALAQALEEHRPKDLIFIDTPGLTRHEMSEMGDLAEFLTSNPDFDVHLVLPAYLSPADMARMIQSYAPFSPKKLVFTRIDETEQFGPLVNASRWSLPISFLCHGQHIPDDLEPASTRRVIELLSHAPALGERAHEPTDSISETTAMAKRAGV